MFFIYKFNNSYFSRWMGLMKWIQIWFGLNYWNESGWIIFSFLLKSRVGHETKRVGIEVILIPSLNLYAGRDGMGLQVFKTDPAHPEPDQDRDGTGRDRNSKPFFCNKFKTYSWKFIKTWATKWIYLVLQNSNFTIFSLQ